MLEVAKHPSPPGNRRPTMTEAYDGRQVVGMDLHRRRSVLVRMTEDGRKLETVRITNSPAALRAVIARAGRNPRVVIEAAYGWYWAVDVLEAAGGGGAPGASAGCQGLLLPAGQERRKGRLGPGRPAADGPAARGVDRPAGDPRAAGNQPLPAPAGQGAHLAQGPGARGAGQARHPGHPYRHLRRARAGVAG